MTRPIGLGIRPRVEYVGVVKQIWTDGLEHDVAAFRGVDRRCWVRLKPNPGFTFGKHHWCKARGRGQHGAVRTA